MFLDEEFLAECNIDQSDVVSKTSLSESVDTYLNEGSVSEWMGFYFKGTSDDVVERIGDKLKTKVKSKEDAEELMEEIDNAIDKIKDRGDGTHTAMNVVMALTISGLGLLVKHLIKANGYESARKEAIKILRANRTALQALMVKNKWA